MKILTLILFLIGWYFVVFSVFIQKDNRVGDSPQLRARLGTILSHTSDGGGEEHLYCYYPKNTAIYPNKAGEYIIKRVSNLEDCSDWLGAVTFNEGSWVSEREKIWWSTKQKIGEDLVENDSSEFKI